MVRSFLLLAFAFNLSVITESFVVHNGQTSRSTVEMRALWRNWIPQADFLEGLSAPNDASNNDAVEELETNAYRNLCMGSILAAAILVLTPQAGIAVSGGGLDYANLDITGKDFSSQSYKGKDFTQVIAKGTNFAKSNLQGCRFYKAYLVSFPLYIYYGSQEMLMRYRILCDASIPIIGISAFFLNRHCILYAFFLLLFFR
jgi:hypothetical protein